MFEHPNKAEVAHAFLERHRAKVRAGEMTVEEYLRKIVGVPEHKLEEMKAKVKI